MVRKAKAEQHETSTRPVIGIGNEYASGTVHPVHRHRRSQLLYAEYGTMLVDAGNDRWMVPPHEGVWIPAGAPHGFQMLSDVGTRSVYFDLAIADQFSKRCQVVGISALLRQLLIEAADVPVNYEPESRGAKIMSLIVEEVRSAPVRPLCLPVPRHPALARCCRRFSEAPSLKESTDAWSDSLGLSRRTFTRIFRQETGLSLGEWRRRACLHAAIARLLAGDTVTNIALDLGYANPAAFTAMFTRMVGASPVEYRKGLS